MNQSEMEDVPKIRIEFVLGTKKLKKVVRDIMRQAIAIKGTRFHAAVALGISPATIINHLGPGVRTEPPVPSTESPSNGLARSDAIGTATLACDSEAIPSPSGRQEPPENA